MHAISVARLPQQHYRPPAVRIQASTPVTPQSALAMYAGSVRPPPAVAPRGRGQQPLTARCSILGAHGSCPVRASNLLTASCHEQLAAGIASAAEIARGPDAPEPRHRRVPEPQLPPVPARAHRRQARQVCTTPWRPLVDDFPLCPPRPHHLDSECCSPAQLSEEPATGTVQISRWHPRQPQASFHP